jgi:hypothetical protein
MIPLFFEEADTALITQIESDLSGTIKRNGRNLAIRNPITFASSPAIVLNDPTDARDNTYEVDSVAVTPVWDYVNEPNAERDGSIAGPPREVQKMIRVSGFVRATGMAQLYDNIAALNRAFNPVLTYNTDLASSEFDVGFVPLKFYTPTDNTSDWANGYIAQQYYVRALSMPVDATTKFDDFSARFVIELLAVDPRKYEQTTQLAERTGSGDLSIVNAKATYDSWPIVKITFVGAPAGDFRYKFSAGIESLKAVEFESTDLSDAAGETLVIDHQKRIAYYDDDDEDKTFAIKSGSKFFRILGGETQTMNFTANLPANASVDVIWRRAFV